ncbi:TPA: acyltransferase family protein [Flavobacterium psychrophilum]|uniref:acyltransferase family protein n=2 Tax=Flavobacterium psychrophilum TaxID=96345 RepID=UPI000B7C2B6F|nr:acyltransferase [Flavobacterium psychrophilum]SNB96945.1 putative acyltransferase [Flavobacterium psychrophilum]GEJ32465.1 acyltransferase [Flavobacterium psychrophilum]GEJ35750.1 acyltransferase [Flavobacterium psychrophilum]GEJ39869.1 acyltransferase [Flavobacterium psychrophilum]GEJ40998.1 acyltransferase [Flavobacterium psychrophilum]
MIVENKNKQKFYGLDHLRALAIVLVFWFHYQIPIFGYPEWLPDYAKFGWTGVDLFFVLSGFLISSQLFLEIKKGNKILYKDFFLKRFFRIIPAYLVVVAIYFCFPLFREKESLPSIWKFLTFTQNLGANLKDYGTFSHAWSLCVEEHFYFFLPIILMFLQISNYLKKGYWLLIILFILGFIVRIYSWNNFYIPKINDENSWLYWYKYIYYPTYNRLDGLLVGVSIAGIYQFYPNLWNKISILGNLNVVLSLVILVLAYFLCYEEQTFYASVFGFPLVAIGYGFLVIGAISPTCFLYKWSSKTTTFIATLSFAIYLTHKGIIHITQNVFENLNVKTESSLMMFICMVTCIICAYLLNLIIEKPFMKLRNQVISKKKIS